MSAGRPEEVSDVTQQVVILSIPDPAGPCTPLRPISSCDWTDDGEPQITVHVMEHHCHATNVAVFL
jgi:hypothetical protein